MSQFDKLIYTAKTHTSGGREGASRSADGRLEVKLSRPGGPGNGTNPEQLFAAGWSACFISSMQVVAGRMKVVLPADVAIDAEVDLARTGDAYGSSCVSKSACLVLSATLLSVWWRLRSRCAHIPAPHAAISMSRSTWSERRGES